MKHNLTKKLTISAVMIAIAMVLSMYAIYQLPNGGAVTLASMVPIIVIAFMYDTSWGILTAIVYALLQMAVGFYPPPVQNFWYFTAVILFDYIIAFGVIGLAGLFWRAMGKKLWAMPVSAGIVVALRFVCHFISGILIWTEYVPEGQSPAVYSFLYNGSYMGIELVLTVVITALMSKVIVKQIQ